MVFASLRQRCISLVNRFAPADPTIAADRERLERIKICLEAMRVENETLRLRYACSHAVVQHQASCISALKATIDELQTAIKWIAPEDENADAIVRHLGNVVRWH